MTTEPAPILKPDKPKPPARSKQRSMSTKTMGRYLVEFTKAHNIPGTATVAELVQAIKNSIIDDEIGDSLNL